MRRHQPPPWCRRAELEAQRFTLIRASPPPWDGPLVRTAVPPSLGAAVFFWPVQFRFSFGAVLCDPGRMDLSTLQYTYVGFAALLVGFTKTSVGGVGILAVLLMALAIPGKASPGVLLPMLIAADIMAVIYYRRSCQWGILLRLMPAAVVGVVLGFFILRAVPDVRFERIIGWVILAMVALDLGLTDTLKRHARGPVMTGIVGISAGGASMIANAAGPVFGIYLLQMGLNKAEFVGTRAWYFLVLNIAKMPFAIGLGLVTPTTLSLNVMYLPAILIGAMLGFAFLKFINIEIFRVLIRVTALVAAGRLILG